MIFYALHPRWGNGDDEDEVKAEVCTAFYAETTKKYLQYLLSITKITKKNEMKWKREPQTIKKQNIMNGHRNENDDYEEWWILHEYIYNIYLKWKLENLYKKETYILYESEFSCCWFSCTIYDN